MIKENADKVSDNPSVSFADSSLCTREPFSLFSLIPPKKAREEIAVCRNL